MHKCINSKIIKNELMKHYRFERQFPYVATECIKYSDVNALNDRCLVEIEVKISLADLKKEFTTSGNKHNKHFVVYCNPDSRPNAIIPNYYYICVPECLVHQAIEIVKGINPKYGVLVCKSYHNTYKIECALKAKALHTKKPDIRVYNLVAKRITSELINLRLKFVR